MIQVIAVTMVGCVRCLRAMAILNKLKEEYSTLNVREIDANSLDLGDLLKDHAASSGPCLLINGEYMSLGDATEHNLRKKFDEILAK